jgi:hypothetical protein
MRLVFSRARVASPSRRTRAAHRADRWSDPRVAVRVSVETPPYHGGIFVVSTPSPLSANLRPLLVLVRAMPSRPTLAAPPAMRRHRRALVLWRPSHQITRAPSIGPPGAPSIACGFPVRRTRRSCGHRGRPRRSLSCATVGCLPAQAPSTNGPLVIMPSSPCPCTAGSAAGLAGIGRAAPSPWPGTQLLSPFSLQGLKCKARAWL